nr:immunoglobulin light chain junction region [Macaca mulatta]
CMQVLQIPYSF